MTDPIKIVGKDGWTGVELIDPNPWNPNVQADWMFDKTRASLRKFGFLIPVVVRSGRDTGPMFQKKQVIDGEHRWKAAKLEGMKQIRTLDVGRMSDAKAKALTDVLNRLHGENDPTRWHDMVESIHEEEPELLEVLPYPIETLNELLADDEPEEQQPEEHSPPPKQRDQQGRLFKKFSVSLPPEQMERAQDQMRRIKAAYKLDGDPAAFKTMLDLVEKALSGRSSVPPPAPIGKRRRKVDAAE